MFIFENYYYRTYIVRKRSITRYWSSQKWHQHDLEQWRRGRAC